MLLITQGCIKLYTPPFEITSKIIETTGIGNNTQMTLPQEIIDAINKVGFFDSIPLRCSNFNRKSVHNSFIIYYDFDCIWQIF